MLLPKKDYQPPIAPTCVIVSDSNEHSAIANSKAKAGIYFSNSMKFNKAHLDQAQRKALKHDFSSLNNPLFKEIGLPAKRAKDGIVTMQMRKKINTPETILDRQSWAEYPADLFMIMLDPLVPNGCIKDHLTRLEEIARAIKNYHPGTPFYLVTCLSEKYEQNPVERAATRKLTLKQSEQFAKQIGAAKHVEINPETWSRESGKQTSLQKLYDEMFKETLKQFKNRPKRYKALEHEAAKAAKRAGTAQENYTPPHTQGYMSANLYVSQRSQEDLTETEVALVVK